MLFFLCFSVSPFDLICSFGLVMAKQLIQQTCLMRCEACAQIQLRSFPLPTFLLRSPAYWRWTSVSGTVPGSDGGIPALGPADRGPASQDDACSESPHNFPCTAAAAVMQQSQNRIQAHHALHFSSFM